MELRINRVRINRSRPVLICIFLGASQNGSPEVCPVVLVISCGAKQKGTVKGHLHRAKANVKTFLPLANEVWGKVMFLHLSVILFTEVGCVSQHAMGQTPQRLTPPWQTHLGRHPIGRHPLGRHPLGRSPRQTPLPPSDTSGYGQRAGGTHRTGMHTCFL